MGFDSNGYYSLREILGYNAVWNIVLSKRGIGKSYAARHFLMKQKGTSMMLYRNCTDMRMGMQSFIDPLCDDNKDLDMFELYEREQFTWDGNDKSGYILYYNGSPKIWFRTLTMTNAVKAEWFPDDMNWIVVEEFIPLVKKKLAGVESEGDAIRTIYKTIQHDSNKSRADKGLKELRVIMFANPFTWDSEILSYFHCIPKTGITRLGPGVVQELVEVREDKRKGKMTADDFLGNEVNLNCGWQNQTDYVDKEWPKNMTPVLSVRLGGRYFAMYRVKGVGTLHVMECGNHTKCNGDMKLDTWGSIDGLKENETCINGTEFLKVLKNRSMNGGIRYKDMNCKFDFMNCLWEVR